MTHFAHKAFVGVNPGQYNQRVHFTGNDEVYKTQEIATRFAAYFNDMYDIDLDVYVVE